MSINVNFRGFSPQVYEAWKNGAFSWHKGLKNGTPFIKHDDVDVTLEDDFQIKIDF